MSETEIALVTRSVEQTVELGKALGGSLRGGELLALIGELGTGKTHLIKGMAEGLGAGAGEAVASPTFTLVNEYEGRVPLIHVDAYRLKNAAELEALGFDEMMDGVAVVAVEWADRVESLMKVYDAIVVRLGHGGESERSIRLENPPRGSEEKLSEWKCSTV